MKYAPRGLLALSADAYGQDYPVSAPAVAAPAASPVAVVRVVGPLTHHPEAFVSNGILDCFDSYDSIKARVSSALASEAHTVLLSLDSPGGHVSGLFSLVEEIRNLAARSGKTLVAHVGGSACSAAFALACSASRVVAAPGATLGSIGIIEALVDQSQLDARMGLTFSILTSGARKADGNPHLPVSPEALAARQAFVTETAESFFGLVSSARGVSVDSVRALEAGLLSAERAQAAGLVDEIATLDELLAALSTPTPAPQGQTPQGERQAMTYTEAIDALRSAAESDDEEGTKARKMLKALEGDEPKDEPKKDDEAKAEESEESDKDEPKKDEAKAQAISLAKVESIVARQLKAQADASERQAILNTRKDLDGKALAALASVPTAQLKDLLASIPRAPASAIQAARAAIGVTGIQGETTTPSQQSAEAKQMMDEAMGRVSYQKTVTFDGIKQVLGATVPASGKGQ